MSSSGKGSPPTRQARRFRTGCKTCKARRVQCDETKPQCKACLSKGRSCPGYTREFKWSTKPEVSSGRKGQMLNLPGEMFVPPESIVAQTTPGPSSLEKGDTRQETSTVDAPTQGPSRSTNEDSSPNPAEPETSPDGWNDMYEQIDLEERRLDELQQRKADTQLSPSLTDFSTFLIEYWFNNVCCMWSSFDSDRNLNRKVALSTWTNDKAVFHCLQAMSAFHLAEQLPHLGDTAMTSWKSAVQAIHHDLSSVTKNNPTQLPTGLLLSLSGIGTTTCWTDSQQLGLPLLKKMKAVLAYYNQSAMRMTQSDRLYLEFFNDSCIYWDIVCRVVTDDDSPIGPSPPLLPTSMLDTTAPHPWVGVSRNTLELFAHAILLCKRYCKRLRVSDFKTATAHSLRDMIEDIHEARALRKTLLNLGRSITSEQSETGDKLTPLSHLVDVAEGYRLAALLHLYQTFKDLEEEQMSEMGGALDETWIQDLALELLDLVRRIPLESGSRCIQPLLYLSVATGLKSCPPVTVPHLADGARSAHQNALENNLTALPQLAGDSTTGSDSISTMKLTRTSMKIGQARRVIVQRVSVLEYSLPTKPISVLKALIKKIWDVWDAEMCATPSARSKHWIEVMEESRLHTMFG
ncbi:hypothetical protein BO71DRAFT_363098 [Aspergillus ellipticus CBS 707.79]|uniref:Zn(2)-C6 fungal-type domain-containing protein n=1 Tax=Aspergillus ellipticus CBS 707.79 TaxID=1448320 RepID=A0A319CWK1_9EURO|nr:hypothetical protein BO71DRAFT_363098 [Aspergillus ellipticus CBS 707.79]